MKNELNTWMSKAQSATDVLVDHKCEIKLRTLRSEGYVTVAEMGHQLDRRDKFYPEVVEVPDAGIATRIGTGYGSVVYGIDDLAVKTNYFASHDAAREMATYLRAVNQLAVNGWDYRSSLETVYGMINYESNEHPIASYVLGEYGEYFGRELFLVKERIMGPNLQEIIEEYGVPWLTEEKVGSLAELFWRYGDAGVKLQGDPADFCWDRNWTAIDAGGWMLYDRHDESCLYANMRSFLGVFSRQVSPGAPARNSTSGPHGSRADRLFDMVNGVAHDVFDGLDNPCDPDAFNELLKTEDLIAPRHARVRALVQYEMEDPFRLDSILANCNLCVAVSRRELFEDLLAKRNATKLEAFYFGDIQALTGGSWIVFYQPYNDAEFSGDQAANQTGVTNESIAQKVLNRMLEFGP